GPAGADVVLNAAREEGLGEADLQLALPVVFLALLFWCDVGFDRARPAGIGEHEARHVANAKDLRRRQHTALLAAEDPAHALALRVENPVASIVDDVEVLVEQ